MSDLEKFLQQAAQRMKERQQAAKQQQQPPRPAQNQPGQPQPAQPPRTRAALPPQPAQQSPPVRPSYRTQEGQISDFHEVVEAEIVEPNTREQGPNRLSSLDTRAKPGSADVSLADERMAQHLQQVFDHSVGQLPKAGGSAQVSTVVANEQTNRKIEVETQKQDVHWVTELLQDPQSLRSAFIASEIFKRPF